jgi:hypothetical protein
MTGIPPGTKFEPDVVEALQGVPATGYAPGSALKPQVFDGEPAHFPALGHSSGAWTGGAFRAGIDG